MARIILTHGDVAFGDQLAAALEAAGHEVLRVDRKRSVVPQPQTPGDLEIAITQAAGIHPGLRLRVTRRPQGKRYVGALALKLSEPIDVERTLAALKQFVS